MGVAEALWRAGPWGQGFGEPLFDGEFEVLAARPVGERHLKLRVRAREAGGSLEAMAFNAQGAAWAAEGESLRLAYRLEVNDYGASAPRSSSSSTLSPPPRADDHRPPITQTQPPSFGAKRSKNDRLQTLVGPVSVPELAYENKSS